MFIMKSKYMKRIMLLATAVLTMSSCDSVFGYSSPGGFALLGTDL